MCGLFGQKIQPIEGYRKMLRDQERKKLTIGVGDIAVIRGETEAFEAVFGLCPSKFDKKLWMFNARSEANANPQDKRDFTGPFEIEKNPYCGFSFKRRRCVVPVTHYFEGPHDKRLSEPYLVERKDQQVFWLGGVWDTWTDRETKESLDSFSIITTPSTELMHKIRHKRAPLIIPDDKLEIWMGAYGKHLIDFFKQNNSADLHCFRVSDIVKKKNDTEEALVAIGAVIK